MWNEKNRGAEKRKKTKIFGCQAVVMESHWRNLACSLENEGSVLHRTSHRVGRRGGLFICNRNVLLILEGFANYRRNDVKDIFVLTSILPSDCSFHEISCFVCLCVLCLCGYSVWTCEFDCMCGALEK